MTSLFGILPLVHRQFTADGGIILEEALGYWVTSLYLVSRAELYRRFKQHGVDLTPEQWMVLVRLWAAEGVTQSELAQKSLRDLPTMSRILATMERSGLITRKPDPNDSRARLVYLSARGRKLRETLVPEARKMVDAMLSGIPERDIEITRRTLQRALDNLR